MRGARQTLRLRPARRPDLTARSCARPALTRGPVPRRGSDSGHPVAARALRERLGGLLGLPAARSRRDGRGLAWPWWTAAWEELRVRTATLRPAPWLSGPLVAAGALRAPA